MDAAEQTVIAEPSDELVDEVVTAANGDMREAIRMLIRGQDAIRAEVLRQVSTGYARRRMQ